ncbi:MAG: hypothetical protein WCI03_15110 [bacterium]|jgi:hypothetical protein
MYEKRKTIISSKKTGESAIVQLRIRDLSQLFNSMDPSPFIDKDLADDAESFIEGWALEFPVNTPITLVVHLEQPPVLGGPDPRRFTELAARNFFQSKADTTRRELRQLMRTGQISLIIGIAFMALCLTLSKGITQEFPSSTTAEWLREGLAVGCWVAMWKPIDIYLYGWWPVLRRLRIYRKMSRLHVELKVRVPAAQGVTTSPAQMV